MTTAGVSQDQTRRADPTVRAAPTPAVDTAAAEALTTSVATTSQPPPVAVGWLVAVRIGFGLVAALAAVRLLWHGWVTALWLDPDVLLGHPLPLGLALPLLPGPWLHGLVGLLGLLGLAIAAGRGPVRAIAATWVVGFAYLELLDQTTYLNHHWAMALVGVLLALAPHGRSQIDRWWLWLFRGQVAVIYVFAGIAKLDPDWLSRGEPLSTWLAARGDLAVVGPLLALPAAGLVLSWAGVVFDLTIVGWLAWRRTRPWAMAAVVGFHAATGLLFGSIGVFPALMIILATVWLDPAWPDRVRSRWPGPARSDRDRSQPATTHPATRCPAAPRWLPGLVVVWLIVQIAIPLRHAWIPGDVRWTEQGGTLAWRVMAEEKVGWATFTIHPADGAAPVRVPITDVLTPRQAVDAAIRPDLLRRTAVAIAPRWRLDGVDPVVTVDAHVAWNGRPAAQLIDPGVDLLHPSAGWIEPAPR